MGRGAGAEGVAGSLWSGRSDVGGGARAIEKEASVKESAGVEEEENGWQKPLRALIGACREVEAAWKAGASCGGCPGWTQEA